MGSSASKNQIISIQNKVKKENTIQTTLSTKHFKFALLMTATKSEIEKIQERWTDFMSNIKDDFIYISTTRYPQTVKINRDGKDIYLSLSTKIDITEEDLQSFTKMFNSIETAIKEVNQKDSIGLNTTESNSSSLNLLVKSN
jgi:hypothetical protein